MNRVEADSVFRFVRLQVSDEMPTKRKVARLRDFVEAFLDFVFAEINLARLCDGADVF